MSDLNKYLYSNINLWIQGLRSFLIGRKLLRVVIRGITKPTKAKDDTDIWRLFGRVKSSDIPLSFQFMFNLLIMIL